ncbi:MAG: hypothetical protein F7C07_01620 [Desulfurococcales archaeon]|nr:hypothetical protein [Desulfurococcales archaeon]
MHDIITGIDARLAELELRLAYSTILGVNVTSSHPTLVAMIRKEEEFFKAFFTSQEELISNPNISAFRRLYWKIGLDPTKVRPSHEALARRVLRGRRIPLINNVVDIGNMLSLSRLVPIGLYDLDKIAKPLSIVPSSGHETFKPIGSERFRIDPGIPLLVDNSGLVVHIYGHRDSEHTKITETTSKVLAVVYGVKPIDPGYLASVLEELLSHIKIFVGAEVETGPVKIVGA